MDEKIEKIIRYVTSLKDNVDKDTHRSLYEQGLNRGMEIAYEAVLQVIEDISKDDPE